VSYSRKKVFEDITNKVANKASFTNLVKDRIKKKNALPKQILNHNVYLEDQFAIEDDQERAKTINYVRIGPCISRGNNSLIKDYISRPFGQ
jgi:hypothetical protein